MKEGEALPVVEKLITQNGINRYAAASGDFNPIHVDHEFARTSQFRSTIAHGMMIAATISEMMTLSFGSPWRETGTMKIRFRLPVYPEDIITTTGEVDKITELKNHRQFHCSVNIVNQDGKTVISGNTSVTVPDKNS